MKKVILEVITKKKYDINKLKGKYKISKESKANKVIGINSYKNNEECKINQIDLINKNIEKYGMNKTKQIKTPCIKISEFERENSDLINSSEYKTLLGTLLYIAVKS